MASGPRLTHNLDGNIAGDVQAVDGDALLARGEYAVQAVIDQQGDLTGLAGLWLIARAASPVSEMIRGRLPP